MATLYIWFGEQKFCDFEIETSDGSIKVHRQALYLNSSFFFEMIDTWTPGDEVNMIRIPEVTSKTMHLILENMYTDKITREMEDAAEELLSWADKYNLPGLKTFCIQVLNKRISLGNVVDLLLFADMFPHKKLKLALFKFVQPNVREVIALNSWPLISNNYAKFELLVKEMLTYFVNNGGSLDNRQFCNLITCRTCARGECIGPPINREDLLMETA